MCKKEYTIEIVTSKNNLHSIIPTSINIKLIQKMYKNLNVHVITLPCNYIHIIKILLALKHYRVFIHKIIQRNNKKMNILVHHSLRYIVDDSDSNEHNDPSLLDYTSSDGN